MDDARRARFKSYFETVLKGDRAALMRKTGLTKGRVAQFFDSDMPFGERAARNVAEKLGLPLDYFEAPGSSELPPTPVQANPTLARLNAYFLELPSAEQAAVMADLHARAARAVGARELEKVTGYAPPRPEAEPTHSPEALRLADYLDSLSPEARARGYARAELELMKAKQGHGAPADAPATPAATKRPAVRS